MKRFILAIFVLGLSCINVDAKPSVFAEKGRFGLEDDEIIVLNPIYNKVIRLGNSSWIVQKKSKYGLVDDNGSTIVTPQFTHADRILGKYVKFGKNGKYCIYNEKGELILPLEYSSLELLHGGMILTCKKYKYGIADFKGNIILENEFDDIYIPEKNRMVIVYEGRTIELVKKDEDKFNLSSEIENENNTTTKNTSKFDVFITKPIIKTSYYGVTFTDYVIKLFSSISPAYEQTIDELMYSQGADTISILMKCSWIPKFPFVYAKNYYQTFINPNNGLLKNVKNNLKTK